MSYHVLNSLNANVAKTYHVVIGVYSEISKFGREIRILGVVNRIVHSTVTMLDWGPGILVRDSPCQF